MVTKSQSLCFKNSITRWCCVDSWSWTTLDTLMPSFFSGTFNLPTDKAIELSLPKITSGAAHDQLPTQHQRVIELLKRRLLWMVRYCIPGRSVHALRPEPQRHLLLKARVYRVLCPSTLAGETISFSANTSRTKVSCRKNKRVAEFLECSIL
jgi:hypothetical protein